MLTVVKKFGSFELSCGSVSIVVQSSLLCVGIKLILVVSWVSWLVSGLVSVLLGHDESNKAWEQDQDDRLVHFDEFECLFWLNVTQKGLISCQVYSIYTNELDRAVLQRKIKEILKRCIFMGNIKHSPV